MDRRDLEQAIAEVGRRMKLDYFYIIGSAAIFASIPSTADEALSGTRDVDVIPSPPEPADAEAMANKIDFVLGEGSSFDEEYGYYVQGVSMDTPKFAPRGWQERAVPVRAGHWTGLCMEIHDLALSKYGIGREKDLAFTQALAKNGHTSERVLLERLKDVDADTIFIELMQVRIVADFKARIGFDVAP